MEETFASFLKNRRVHLALTQQQVADFLGIPQGTVSAWENGLQAPRAKGNAIQKLADLLRVSPEKIQSILKNEDRGSRERRVRTRIERGHVTGQAASILLVLVREGIALTPDLVELIAANEKSFVKSEEAPHAEVMKLLRLVERHGITTTVPDVLLRFRS